MRGCIFFFFSQVFFVNFCHFSVISEWWFSLSLSISVNAEMLRWCENRNSVNAEMRSFWKSLYFSYFRPARPLSWFPNCSPRLTWAHRSSCRVSSYSPSTHPATSRLLIKLLLLHLLLPQISAVGGVLVHTRQHLVCWLNYILTTEVGRLQERRQLWALCH